MGEGGGVGSGGVEVCEGGWLDGWWYLYRAIDRDSARQQPLF